MIFFLRNLSAESVYPGFPWEGPQQALPAVARTSKPEMIKWACEVTTEHCFYSSFEGESQSLRLSKANPAYQCHGIVADYDAKIPPEMLAGVAKNCPTEFLPNFVSRTFSGGARLVWLFEKPILVAGNLAASSFMKTIMSELKLKKLLPGLDEPALTDPCKYYERGTSWQKISDYRIRPEFTWKWMTESGKRLAWKTGEVVIPLEVLRDQIEKEYPGSWHGAFEIGARCRRFWDPKADNETGAVLRESGFQCFTGPEPFVPWGQLLGEAFVKRYDADRIGKVLDNIFMENTGTEKYWFKDGFGRWSCTGSTGISRILRTDFGLDGRVAKGGTYSEVDKALLEVSKFRRLEAAMPFVHRRPGPIKYLGRHMLNICQAKCLTPAPEGALEWGEKFPWLGTYLSELLGEGIQLNTFLAWWKRFYQSGLNYTPRQGHALYFVGPSNCGKTLLNHKIIGASVGGAVDAQTILVKNKDFTGNNLEYPVMALDDSTAASDYRAYLKYSARVKAFVANTQIEFNQKYGSMGSVEWLGRVIVSMNDDAKSLQMIPDLEQTLVDKIMLFKVSRPTTYDFHDSVKLEEDIERELPWMLRWLLNWDPPKECIGESRFGVKAYHHPELHREATESGLSSSFLDILGLFLDEWRVAHDTAEAWEGSAAQLLSEMSNCERVSVVSREFSTRQIGLHLRSLSTKPEFGIRQSDARKKCGYVWRLPIESLLN